MELHVPHSLHQLQSGTRTTDQMEYCGDTTAIYYKKKKNTNQVFLIKFLSGQVPSVRLGQIDFFL